MRRRQGEALGLQWADVDLARGTITVRQQLQRIKRPGEAHATLQLARSRPAAEKRTVTRPEAAVLGRRTHRQRQNEARLQRGNAWYASGFVFTGGDGRPVDPSNLMRGFRQLLKTAALPAIRFQDLRHSCASCCRLAGSWPTSWQAMPGYSDIRVTLGTTYGHVLPQAEKRRRGSWVGCSAEPCQPEVVTKWWNGRPPEWADFRIAGL